MGLREKFMALKVRMLYLKIKQHEIGSQWNSSAWSMTYMAHSVQFKINTAERISNFLKLS